MSNTGFTGFLVKKTIQPFPIRQQESNNFTDYQRQNLILFINKKITDMRLSYGTNEISAKNLTNFKIQTPGNKEHKINLKDEDLNPPDDGESEFRSKTRAKPIDPKQRVAELIGVELQKRNLTPQLFQQYKLANLKVNLQKLSTQKEEKINFVDLNHIELEDDEQIEYFLQQLTLENPDLKVSNILNVNVEEKSDQKQKNIQEVVQKKINQEKFNEILKKNVKDYVKVYKESRYDQFEPQFKKSSNLKMATIKKQKETQEKLFEEIFQSDKKQKTSTSIGQFIRKHKKVQPKLSYLMPRSQRQSQHNMQSQLSLNHVYTTKSVTQSQNTITSIGRINKFDPGLDVKMQELIDRCNDVQQEEQIQNVKIKKGLKNMKQVISRSVRLVKSAHKQQEQNETKHHEGFIKYQKESQFRRKLVEYLLNKVPNKNDVLSQKAVYENTEKFRKRISQETF